MEKTLQNFIALLIAFFLLSTAQSQSCANYTTTRTTGITYSSISSTGYSIDSWRNNGTFSQDDNRSIATDIGFDFWYNGSRYSQFSVSTNGFVDFSSSTAAGGPTTGAFGYSNTAFSNTTAGSRTYPALAPFYDDMTAQGGVDALGNSIKYLVSGTAPNRILTIEWINMAVFGNTTPSINFQVKLHETTGVIDYIYGTMTSGSATWSYTCGINSNIASNTVANLKTLQTANTNTFNNTPKDNLTVLPTNNTQITFVPPTTTPALPSGTLTFAGVTQTGMTVNWTNWCTNEVGYVLYNSVDNVTFNYVTQTTSNITTYGSTGLLPGTLYYWKLYAVTEGFLSSVISGSQFTNAAGNKVSVVTGNWNTAGTWTPAGVPSAADNVTIANGHTVTIDVNATCNNLIVGQGVSGLLQIGSNNTARTISVNNNITINTGARFFTNPASNITHRLTVKGNLINNGNLNFVSDANSLCNVTLNKNGNQTISGTGAINSFNLITLNMGASINNTLDVTSSNFTVPSNFLTLTNGTFKLSTINATNITPFTALATIVNSAGFECNSSTATVSFPTGISLFGNLIVKNGIVNIGDAANENVASNGGVFQIYGGTVTIAGQYFSANINTLAKFTISGGILTLPTVSSTSTTIAPFQIDGAGSTFNMSGGTIVIQQEGGTGAQNLGYTVLNISNSAVTGGTLQIGNASTPATQFININSSARVGSLLVNSANATAFLNTNSLLVTNGITVTTGVLNANNLNLTLGGNWLDAGTFTPGTGTVTFNGINQAITKTTGETFNHLTLNGSGTKTLGGDISTNGNFTIATGVTFDITTNNYAVNVKGNWTNNGTFLSNNGTVTFDGAAAQTIGGTSIANFKNITLNNAAGASLAQAQNLIGALTLTLGTFATNAQVFTLISNITGTARIATIPVGADITGNITMQRYIGAGATNWRFLTVPTSGAKITDWVDDFIMSGFTGSQFPLWPSAANPWPSIYFYDETKPGIQDSGYVAASNTTNSIIPGKGLWVWSGDTITGTQAFTVDVTGPSNKGTINLPVTFTSSTGGTVNDGWNMAGNPYPSTIDWDSPNWTKTKINGAIYIWNPQIQQFASYVFGIGTNGGSRYISSSQAFWVQANAASPVLQIKETCKSAVDQSFLRDAVADQQLLTFGVQKGTTYDEAILRFIDGATNNFDADFDALKLASTDAGLPYIALINNTDELSVNSYNLGQSITMPIKVTCSTNGLTTLTFTKTNLTNLSCAILEDLVTGAKIDIIANSAYTFYNNSSTTTARFLLHLWNNKTKVIIPPTCYGLTNAEIIAQTSGNGPWNFNLSDNSGTLSSFISSNDTTIINNIGGGTYYLQISDQSLTCAASVDTIIIINPTPVVVSSTFTNPSSSAINDGTIDLTVSGGAIPYTFNWVTSSTTEDLNNLPAGSYEVTVLDANGCSIIKTITLDLSTGINNLSTSEWIALYPNPAKDFIAIEGKNLPNTVLTISNLNGQVVFTKTLNSNKEIVNVSNFSTGVYFYELKNNSTAITKGKLIIVNK